MRWRPFGERHVMHGRLTCATQDARSWRLEFNCRLLDALRRGQGFDLIDGVSLTVNQVGGLRFDVKSFRTPASHELGDLVSTRR